MSAWHTSCFRGKDTGWECLKTLFSFFQVYHSTMTRKTENGKDFVLAHQFSARRMALTHINKRKKKSIIESNLTNVHRNRIPSPINNTHTHGPVLQVLRDSSSLMPYWQLLPVLVIHKSWVTLCNVRLISHQVTPHPSGVWDHWRI